MSVDLHPSPLTQLSSVFTLVWPQYQSRGWVQIEDTTTITWPCTLKSFVLLSRCLNSEWTDPLKCHVELLLEHCHYCSYLRGLCDDVLLTDGGEPFETYHVKQTGLRQTPDGCLLDLFSHSILTGVHHLVGYEDILYLISVYNRNLDRNVKTITFLSWFID